MTKRDELLAVAERCEKASEGSRELDGRIWCAVSGLEFVMWDGAGCVYRGKDGLGHIAHDHVKNWSTSLDAAMTLALPDRLLSLWQAADLRWYARTDCDIQQGSGATAPLTLMSLWLRARSEPQTMRDLAIAPDESALRAQAEMES